MNFKEIIATVAPTLGAAFGGPLGALAGKVLSTSLGGGNQKAIESAVLSGDPQVLLKVKEAEIAFQSHMADLGVTEDQLQVEDRKSARELGKNDSLTPRWLAFFVTCGFFGVLIFMLTNGKPQSGGDALLVMLGALGGAWASVIAYYFGSNSGSARKTELLSKAAAV